MGLKSTMNRMLGEDGTTASETGRSANGDSTTDGTLAYGSNSVEEPSRLTNSNRASHKLPPGTGPGTSGKPGPVSTEEGYRSGTGRGSSGLATGAGTKHGGGRTSDIVSGTGDTRRNEGTKAGAATGVAALHNKGATTNQVHSDNYDSPGSGIGSGYTSRGLASDYDRRDRDQFGHSRVLDHDHQFGHNRSNALDMTPSDNAVEYTTQLNPITHENVRHHETEEVERVRNINRNIHHVQHHTQPVMAEEELPEQHREIVHPVTRINETHTNKAEDSELFDGQIRQHRDILHHAAKERTIIDKGTIINETTHHHIHHVIQPIIKKETIDKQHIHTTIPIHEVTHEAPLIHQSQTHAPVPIEHFLQRGGKLSGAVPHDEIGNKVLNKGQCVRDVDGVAENLARELNLGDHTVHKSGMKQTARDIDASAGPRSPTMESPRALS